jgi:hypothetical protein
MQHSPQMPFKHNAARRHRVAKVRYRITNWPAHETGLRRRGDVTFWLDEVAVVGWQAPPWTTPGGQPGCSELAIEFVLTLQLPFALPCGKRRRSRAVCSASSGSS